jgi:hypothetical protein
MNGSLIFSQGDREIGSRASEKFGFEPSDVAKKLRTRRSTPRGTNNKNLARLPIGLPMKRTHEAAPGVGPEER